MADQCMVSAESEERSFVVKVHGYSRSKELLKTGECVSSPPFSVQGRNWFLRYYPNGSSESDPAGFILLVLETADAKDVSAKASSIGVLGKDGLPVSYFDTIFVTEYSPRDSYLGLLVNRENLEESGDVIDDCFSIKCDLTLKKDIYSGNNQFVRVPPTDLHMHFGNLLESMDGADVTFHVGGHKFLAHRLMLAARSSVFKAELLGAMKENTSGSAILIHEMEPDVFKALLHFIYTDSPPALEMTCNEYETRLDLTMAGHLLVAADRYNIQRLKLICEHRLWSCIDANTVATSLALAEQHNCSVLKEACLQFLVYPSNLEAMMASDGYEYLKTSCPSALKELIARLLPVEMKAAKEIVMTI